jgi:hypothetical protein
MLNAPTMECDRIDFRRSGPVQKRQQIFETVSVRHRGASFGIAADLSPRLSTFERCWLGDATGRVRSPLAQRQGDTRDLSAIRPVIQPALPEVRARSSERRCSQSP